MPEGWRSRRGHQQAPAVPGGGLRGGELASPDPGSATGEHAHECERADGRAGALSAPPALAKGGRRPAASGVLFLGGWRSGRGGGAGTKRCCLRRSHLGCIKSRAVTLGLRLPDPGMTSEVQLLLEKGEENKEKGMFLFGAACLGSGALPQNSPGPPRSPGERGPAPLARLVPPSFLPCRSRCVAPSEPGWSTCPSLGL